MTALVSGAAVLTAAGDVLASAGGDDGGGKAVLLLLLLAGPLFAGAVHLRYRNTDKRHHHESETRSEMLGVQADDVQTGRRTGLSNKRMRGANSRKVRSR